MVIYFIYLCTHSNNSKHCIHLYILTHTATKDSLGRKSYKFAQPYIPHENNRFPSIKQIRKLAKSYDIRLFGLGCRVILRKQTHRTIYLWIMVIICISL